MKSRYLLGAGAALAVAFGCAEANAQFAFMGGPYPTVFYVGPEGGWTSLSNQKDTITTVPFRVDSGVVIPPNGPFFNKFNGSARYDSGFNAGAPARDAVWSVASRRRIQLSAQWALEFWCVLRSQHQLGLYWVSELPTRL